MIGGGAFLSNFFLAPSPFFLLSRRHTIKVELLVMSLLLSLATLSLSRLSPFSAVKLCGNDSGSLSSAAVVVRKKSVVERHLGYGIRQSSIFAKNFWHDIC